MIETSYKKSNGMAKAIWLITSGGVKIAATIKIITIATLLLFFNELEHYAMSEIKLITAL